MKKFANAKVYVEGKGIIATDLLFDDKIRGFSGDGEVIEIPQNATVFPAFIDSHVHGAGGSDAMDGEVSALKTVAKTLAADGTATFLATTMTQSPANIKKALSAVKAYREENPEEGAEIFGVHLEGPFIAEKFKGAQP